MLKKYHVMIRLILFTLLTLFLLHSLNKISLFGLDEIDAVIYDFRLAVTMPNEVDERIAIIDIDNDSINKIGRWPWNRSISAKLVQELVDYYQVRVLGFDVVFDNQDNSSGLSTLERLARTDLKDNEPYIEKINALRATLDYDQQFADALKDRPVVLGYFFSTDQNEMLSGQLPQPVFANKTLAELSLDIKQVYSYGTSFPKFVESAKGNGHFLPTIDSDGTVRRVPLVVKYQDSYYDSLVLAMLKVLLGEQYRLDPYIVGSEDKRYQALEGLNLTNDEHNFFINVDQHGQALVPFRGAHPIFPYYSAADILDHKIPVEKLSGRMVLVGTTATALLDLRQTPVGEVYPGVEVHANLLSGILNDTIPFKPAFALGIEFTALVVLGLFLIVFLPRCSPFMAVVVTIVLALLSVAGNFYAWSYEGYDLQLGALLMMIFSLFVVSVIWGFFVVTRTKRKVTDLFGQYIPPELAAEMSENPEEYSMEGRSEELTVLFTDVRNFTRISEGMEPKELTMLVNEFLSAMTAEISYYRGTLDKYIGDAIMAFWGAPISDANHAGNSIKAAFRMQQSLQELNKTFMLRNWPALSIGVGVNTGIMTVGDMGSKVRKAYTVLGDSVNLASRLEGLTKTYGVPILVGQTTKDRLNDEFVFRLIDRVRVKGKGQITQIWQPIGEVGQVPENMLAEIAKWHALFELYLDRQWLPVELGLQKLMEDQTTAITLYQLFFQRIQVLRHKPPHDNWDGATDFLEK